jgi:protocatechuate 3,4-dioxygenase beta subunit
MTDDRIAKSRELLAMADSAPSAYSRRRFLQAVAVAAAPVTLIARVQSMLGRERETVELEPTPAVGEKLELTPEETAGPFFRPSSPLKTNFRELGVTGSPVRLTGVILDRKARPIPGALLDFWHADGEGAYDLKGFRCRGHQFSDTTGRYTLETVVPGLYPGRTRHYHVRLQAAHGPVLTTQLYFPGEAQNASDSLFRPDLLLKIRATGSSRVAIFNFVLEV